MRSNKLEFYALKRAVGFIFGAFVLQIAKIQSEPAIIHRVIEKLQSDSEKELKTSKHVHHTTCARYDHRLEIVNRSHLRNHVSHPLIVLLDTFDNVSKGVRLK